MYLYINSKNKIISSHSKSVILDDDTRVKIIIETPSMYLTLSRFNVPIHMHILKINHKFSEYS
jgi:hypothetical protein